MTKLNNKQYINMENKKQTAVEWLISKLQWTYADFDSFSQYVQQAKEMQKQQIMDAYYTGWEHDTHPDELVNNEAEQYYNQEYGS